MSYGISPNSYHAIRIESPHFVTQFSSFSESPHLYPRVTRQTLPSYAMSETAILRGSTKAGSSRVSSCSQPLSLIVLCRMSLAEVYREKSGGCSGICGSSLNEASLSSSAILVAKLQINYFTLSSAKSATGIVYYSHAVYFDQRNYQS